VSGQVGSRARLPAGCPESQGERRMCGRRQADVADWPCLHTPSTCHSCTAWTQQPPTHLLSSCCRGLPPCPGPLAAPAGDADDPASCMAVGVLPPAAAGGCGLGARCCCCCACCCCCSKKAGVRSPAAPACGFGSAGALLAGTGDTAAGPRCVVLVCFCCAAFSRPCRPPAPPVCSSTTHNTDTEARTHQPHYRHASSAADTRHVPPSV
jgi:hypothetical protein